MELFLLFKFELKFMDKLVGWKIPGEGDQGRVRTAEPALSTAQIFSFPGRYSSQKQSQH